ncbi:hypothetical protein AGMMS50212_01450 [Spirochaetia bacterium]|nr:hypothetical protein AGMMS50212_01450 [Spirochaetia bacterium]
MRATRVFTAFFFVSILCGCGTITNVVEMGGHVLDGTAFLYKTKVVYRDNAVSSKAKFEFKVVQAKDGTQGAQFSCKEMPELLFYAKLREGENEDDFELSAMRFLAGSIGGWVEFYCGLKGSSSLKPAGAPNAEFTLSDVKTTAITNAALRRNASTIYGERALEIMRGRQNRILAYTAYMKEKDAPDFKNKKEFEKYWEEQLLPETVSKKRRPAAYNEIKTEKKDFVLAEDVKWNSKYSEEYFPENLRTLRNSGSLLRDWEEAFAWFYLEYNWDKILDYLYEQKNLVRVKPKVKN